MTREQIQGEIEEILTNNGFLKSDAENFFEAMNQMLHFFADETEKSEPYAYNTINALRIAANNIDSYDSIVDGLVSGDDDEDML